MVYNLHFLNLILILPIPFCDCITNYWLVLHRLDIVDVRSYTQVLFPLILVCKNEIPTYVIFRLCGYC